MNSIGFDCAATPPTRSAGRTNARAMRGLSMANVSSSHRLPSLLEFLLRALDGDVQRGGRGHADVRCHAVAFPIAVPDGATDVTVRNRDFEQLIHRIRAAGIGGTGGLLANDHSAFLFLHQIREALAAGE